ncbi:hypothetical protein, unlikely [Trypanosoma brucei gambiense DAL972]|uniref:Uncharacterized protein n=1 Tax=Trypanosoma brucei gambiense (strain MHOM/CI/86/DAL972) TaxID=679716 RepID=C9ZIB5_TRYB9|nr:hypothetical protein, unlikely [Trypanosoma brucei gambiense DAL972]CBH08907.1 hypothetical protein, unlikely [Trypanosoma brucei gambiense DAL972]|eukprot:XP_011771348.1 hypothetical protein, unlikely [Trypanosoma brucei gambiense DAL972]
MNIEVSKIPKERRRSVAKSKETKRLQTQNVAPGISPCMHYKLPTVCFEEWNREKGPPSMIRFSGIFIIRIPTQLTTMDPLFRLLQHYRNGLPTKRDRVLSNPSFLFNINGAYRITINHGIHRYFINAHFTINSITAHPH